MEKTIWKATIQEMLPGSDYTGLVLFVRHGESESNVKNVLTDDLSGYPLTDIGIRQAENIGKEIATVSPSAIYTSPVQRAVETASIISDFCGLIPVHDPRLRELGMGSLNNQSTLKFSHSSPGSSGVERWVSIASRMKEFLETSEGIVIAVSHAYPIKVIISELLGVFEEASRGIEIGHCSVSCISTDPDQVISIGSRTVPSPDHFSSYGGTAHK